jgi:hypothetical protein
MYKIDQAQAIRIVDHLCVMFNVKLAYKSETTFMKVISYLSPYFTKGISKKDFMEETVTTVWNTVYINDKFFINPSAAVDCFLHELLHVEDDRQNPVQYKSRYLSNPHYRAIYEAHSISAKWQLSMLYNTPIAAITFKPNWVNMKRDIIGSLSIYKKYGFNESDLKTMAAIITSDLITLNQTGLTSSTAINATLELIKKAEQENVPKESSPQTSPVTQKAKRKPAKAKLGKSSK